MSNITDENKNKITLQTFLKLDYNTQLNIVEDARGSGFGVYQEWIHLFVKAIDYKDKHKIYHIQDELKIDLKDIYKKFTGENC